MNLRKGGAVSAQRVAEFARIRSCQQPRILANSATNAVDLGRGPWRSHLVLVCVCLCAGVSLAGDAKKDAKPHRDYAETLPGTAFKLEMIAIPGGEFTMGSRQREKKLSREDEAPPHLVRI